MQHTIKKQVSIYPLDARLNPCSAGSASFQLEVYRTNEGQKKNISVLNVYNKRFSYQIGDSVDVSDKVVVNRWCWLTNVVKNAFLTDYLSKAYQYWR